jgi:hypothetical protein
MIQANELRIGNLVKTNSEWHENGISEIHYISPLHIVVRTNGVYQPYDINKIEPIPLTEEWHNKFQVYKNGFNSFEYVLPRKNNIYLKVIFTGDFVMLKQEYGLSQVIVSIWNKDITKRDMFVHEWQNLYFALTSEELTPKN